MGFIQLPQKKRIRIRLSNTERLRKARAEHKEWLRSKGLDNIKPITDRGTLEFEPIKDRQGVPMGNKIPVTEKGVGLQTKPQQYSGERKLLGIATLHKSNMVPVFDQQDAKDIAKMRR
jgi:hypothetical protein